MAATVSYTASMRTRKTSSSSNAKSSCACQEYYTDDYNYVGIVHFAGLSQANKVITGIQQSVTSAKAGYGTGHTKTVYVRKSRYQAASQSGITGGNYYGDALGTFTGAFYGNTTSYNFSGTLLSNLAAYFEAGNNTICLFNPSPVKSSQGYSNNYLQWESATITITYEEAVSVPSASASSVYMGSSITIYTNRRSTNYTHSLQYVFCGLGGVISNSVDDSISWVPPVSLAERIPNATNGTCEITCITYCNGTMVGMKSIYITLHVPTSVLPSISAVNIAEAVSGIETAFETQVQNKSRLNVSITATGARGSTISSYRTTLNGTTYADETFTTGYLSVAGDNTLTATVTDSRGRSVSYSLTFHVTAYSPPTISAFTAARCNADGSALQADGTRVWISLQSAASSVNEKNTMSCSIAYRVKGSNTWTQVESISASNYTVNLSNHALPVSAMFGELDSYDLQVTVRDSLTTVTSVTALGTKKVILDIKADGTGVAFGKVATQANAVELEESMGLYAGGKDLSNLTAASLGALPISGGMLTGNLSISGYLYPSLYLLPYYNSTTNRTVFEGSYVGASSFASWEDNTGNNRRMQEVRNAAYQSSRDYAVVLRDVVDGSYSTYRVFHAGMATPVPIANGGTAASSAKGALNNLGIFFAETLPSSGTDGQICLVPV